MPKFVDPLPPKIPAAAHAYNYQVIALLFIRFIDKHVLDQVAGQVNGATTLKEKNKIVYRLISYR